MSEHIYKNLPVFDHLMTFKDGLINDFLNYHADWQSTFKKAHIVNYTQYDITQMLSSKEAWKAQPLRYEHSPGGKVNQNEQVLKHFPTAKKILKHYEGQLGIVVYSILEANSVIGRHTGPENRTGEYVRIHIPLIVPPGDIFLEVGGEEVDWSEPFGFNNQIIHSAHNYSPYRRLVFLIDIQRTFVGLPPGVPYNEKDELTAPPFVRKPRD
jgi:hypothetical protein